ncbi:MAG: phosphatidylserine decarboxylase [Thermoanaerobaculia bacterium]|nr:phosphatidylserine decarboxylase [Thermoanaerobaculia bacterium]
MNLKNRIVTNLRRRVESDDSLKAELERCIASAAWTPPGWSAPISDLGGLYTHLDQLLGTTPVDATFDNLFHGLYYIVSQDDNALQRDKRFVGFQRWLEVFVEVYGSMMNTAESANGLDSFLTDKTFEIENFLVDPGGFGCFNAFFSRRIKPGKRPIGAATLAYDPPTEGHPIGPNPPEDPAAIHKNMCDDQVIVVPADSVYKGWWPISSDSTITVSKGNTYSIQQLLRGSQYADRFDNGIFTHSYLSVFTYHRYHVPVRGTVLETRVIMDEVFANVVKDAAGNLSATDGTGYQFKQERGLIVLDSPVGLVALLPIGMDFISSANFSVEVGDYLNKGDEFGYFLFGGSDMIMLFELGKDEIDIHMPEKPATEKFYKLGQVFGAVK